MRHAMAWWALAMVTALAARQEMPVVPASTATAADPGCADGCRVRSWVGTPNRETTSAAEAHPSRTAIGRPTQGMPVSSIVVNSHTYSLALDSDANNLRLNVTAASGALAASSGSWIGATDNKWTTNTSANNNWTTAYPSAQGHVATFSDASSVKAERDASDRSPDSCTPCRLRRFFFVPKGQTQLARAGSELANTS